MDEVKYQVFISSTYIDLKSERNKILDILLVADCIPAGMEAFVAEDKSQFEVIKRVIDLCDYYILIIGQRYGNVNEDTDLSYTEMEYDYAIDKGIPVLVFVIDDSVELPDDKKESDPHLQAKLIDFKRKAMTNRLATIWKDETDLVGKVAISIMKAKNEVKRPGWHRGGDTDYMALAKENQNLKVRIEAFEALKDIDREELDDNVDLQSDPLSKPQRQLLNQKFYGVNVTIHFTEIVMIFTSNTRIDRTEVSYPLEEVFKHISVRLTGVNKVSEFEKHISSLKSGYSANKQDCLVIKNKLEQLGLIESYVGKDDIEMVKLTEAGKAVMNELNGL